MASTINSTGTTSSLSISGDTSGALALQTNSTTAVTIDTSQNVGIGTASPSSFGALAVRKSISSSAGVSNVSAHFSDAANSTLIIGHTGGATNLVADQAMAFGYTNGTTYSERMRIDSSGNVIMGNTAYDYSANGFGFGASNTYSYFTRTSGYALLVNLKTTTGAMQSFTYNQSGVGNVSTNGSNCTFNSTSDYRLKQNVQPMTGALAKVALLKPVTYNWIRENQAGEGFIAHELQEVVPEAVVGTKDAVDEEGNPVYQAIDQSVLVATLTAAIQELNAKVDAQATTITALQAKVGN